MKKEKMILGAAMAAVLSGMTILSSCDPDCKPCEDMAQGTPATLTISLASGTSATKSTVTQTQAEDNAINTVDVFVFRNTETTSADYNKLDSYKRFSGDQISTLEIKTTTGPKTVCVVVNSNIDSYIGVTDLETFRTIVSPLSDETLGDWVMYGEGFCSMDVTTSITITVKRLISKITINSIRTNFAGTPYQGMTLSDCKLYLVNVHGDKVLYSGDPTSEPVVLNKGKLVAEDVNSTAQAGLIMDNISGIIGDAEYTTEHDFYCYSNLTSEIQSSTKLVLQAKLDGVTYFYPLPVNQEEYGYVAANGHCGVNRNTAYSYKMVINRPGSLDPNEPLVPGVMSLTLNVANWTIVNGFIREY